MPQFDRPQGFTAAPSDDLDLLARLAKLDIGEVGARVRGGSKPYIARLDGMPVAYGWSAKAHASIGEVGLSFDVPHGQRYLWDFATLPEWRGLRVYPALMQTMLLAESGHASRFWIGHVVTNAASRGGIRRAGFGVVGVLGWSGNQVGLAPVAGERRARAAAAVAGVPLLCTRRFSRSRPAPGSEIDVRFTSLVRFEVE